MKRLFVAVKINPDPYVTSVFQTIRNELREEIITWVAPENWHITLKFLGDTPDKNVNPINDILEESCKEVEAFDISIKDFGYFGNITFPRVLWLGIEENEEWLARCRKSIVKKFETLGYEKEDTFYSPHLTLGRVKSLNNTLKLRELEADYKNVLISSQRVSHIYLVESKLMPKGPVYNILKTFDLK